MASASVVTGLASKRARPSLSVSRSPAATRHHVRSPADPEPLSRQQGGQQSRTARAAEVLQFYPVFDSPAALAWLGQVAALELHVPQWRIEQAAVDRYPDRVVFQDRKAERTNAARQVCTWCGHRATIAPRPTTRQGPTRAHYTGLHVRHVCRWCQHLSPIPAAGVLQPGRLHLGRQSSLQ